MSLCDTKNVSSHHALLSTFTFPFAICLKYSFILFYSVMSAYSYERKHTTTQKKVYYFYKYKYSSILSSYAIRKDAGKESVGKLKAWLWQMRIFTFLCWDTLMFCQGDLKFFFVLLEKIIFYRHEVSFKVANLCAVKLNRIHNIEMLRTHDRF